MKHCKKVLSWRLIVPLAVALFAAAIPRDAHAIVRGTGVVGVEHIRGTNGNGTMFQYRLEGAFSVAPWVQLGAYAQGLSPIGGEGRTGWGGGAMLALRPALPLTGDWDPMGFATIGYQRAPAGTALYNAFTVELGGGLVYHASSLIDLEARGGYVGLLNSSLHGITVSLGLSLNI